MDSPCLGLFLFSNGLLCRTCARCQRDVSDHSTPLIFDGDHQRSLIEFLQTHLRPPKTPAKSPKTDAEKAEQRRAWSRAYYQRHRAEVLERNKAAYHAKKTKDAIVMEDPPLVLF